MPTAARTPRSGLLALAIGLVLTSSLVAAPTLAAEDDGPEAVVSGLFADVTAGDFAALPGWFCDDYADQAATLDPSMLLADFPPGVDSESVLSAFPVAVRISSMETLSQSDTEAVVRVEADLEISVDEAVLEPIVLALLQAGGEEPDPQDVADIVDGLSSKIERTQDISGEIKVVPRDDGSWGLICSPVRDQSDADGDAGPDAGTDTGSDMDPDASSDAGSE